MSFLRDTVLPGSASLHTGGRAADSNGHRTLKRVQSHAALLSPLIRLVKDPVATLGSAVSTLTLVPEQTVPQDNRAARKQVLYLRLKDAETYDEWKTAATELDALEDNDAWKSEDHSTEYDYELVAARLKELDDARVNCDIKRMEFLIRTSLTRGLGGMGDLRLYKHSHIGTKSLIERYIDSVQKTLTALLEVSAAQGANCPVKTQHLVDSLLQTRQSFGRSALLLSGGGTFGMNHIGVVKSLWQARLLPRIISGASAGSIVCAVLCTKTDAEIPNVLQEFCYGDLAVFEKEGDEDGIMKKAARFLKYGSLFDISHLLRVMRNLLGDITFQESYNRTRRILNITVSSASLYELPRLLNYITAPDVMIWSAVCASCSVPFIFSAASLLAKDRRTGKEVPWDPTPNSGFIDGSVDNDLPMNRLAEMFNVNHFIVSQVNPHVVPFLAKEDEMISAEANRTTAFTAGPSWIHHMANLAKGEALHRLHVLSEMGIFPNTVTKVRSILNQRYSGDITILPTISYTHFPKVLSNPTTEYMLQCMLTGERATWPKLSRVQNHVAIELAIDETIHKFKARAVFSPSQVDLRLHNLSRPLSHGSDLSTSKKTVRKATRFMTTHTSSTLPHATFPTHTRLPQRKGLSRPIHDSKPYLPSYSRMWNQPSGDSQRTVSAADALSSSTNPGESDLSSDDEVPDESDTSDYFSPSSPHSPPSVTPDLWPSTRQLFPYASQPVTPSTSNATFSYRNNSGLNLAMTTNPSNTSGAPSSPEARYKRLFHPHPGATDKEHAAQRETQEDFETTVEQVVDTTGPTLHLQYSESLPHSESAQPTTLKQTDSVPESQTRQSERSPGIPWRILTSAEDLQPDGIQFNVPPDTPSRKTNRHTRRESSDAERTKWGSRRNSSQINLPLDLSGTRGMMLRRKKSERLQSERSG